MKEKGRLKRIATVLIVVGIIYAIAPDPVPGPIDDIVVNAITLGISYILRRCEQKITKGVSTVLDSVNTKVDEVVDANVTAGKMSEETAGKVRSAAEKVQKETETTVRSAVNTTCNVLENSATQKITGFK